jgi:hypothetical protein
MNILSHRGYWKTLGEKNKQIAFERSFHLGFGTETDIRDRNNALVISHDIPEGGEVSFIDFLKLVKKSDASVTVALNIKADGLADLLKREINKFPELDFFAFDMSVPDMRDYFRCEIPVFTRMSEVEKSPSWLSHSAGVWLDAFENDWFVYEDIQKILNWGKRVCVVSPELHQRDYKPVWEMLKSCNHEQMLLCTDYPEDAQNYFG